MTKEELGSLEVWFQKYLDRFRNGDGVLHPMLELKCCHSIRVAENAAFIAASLKATEPEKYLAEGAGLVHDVGRFTQYAEYGTFGDAETIDHGIEGRKVLETEDFPFLNSSGDREQLLCAVEYHNKSRKDIPRDLSREQDRLLRLIRDADKLDIMELVLSIAASDDFQDLSTMLPHIRLCREVSPEVLQEAQSNQSVSYGNLSTVGDILVLIGTWFYELNYLSALRLAMERDLLSRIRSELPEEEAIDDLFAGITFRASGFIEDLQCTEK
jgi:hypothetical protein